MGSFGGATLQLGSFRWNEADCLSRHDQLGLARWTGNEHLTLNGLGWSRTFHLVRRQRICGLVGDGFRMKLRPPLPVHVRAVPVALDPARLSIDGVRIGDTPAQLETLWGEFFPGSLRLSGPHKRVVEVSGASLELNGKTILNELSTKADILTTLGPGATAADQPDPRQPPPFAKMKSRVYCWTTAGLSVRLNHGNLLETTLRAR